MFHQRISIGQNLGNGTVVIQARSVKVECCQNPVLKTGLHVNSLTWGRTDACFWCAVCFVAPGLAGTGGSAWEAKSWATGTVEGSGDCRPAATVQMDITVTKKRKQNGARKVQELLMETRISPSPLTVFP